MIQQVGVGNGLARVRSALNRALRGKSALVEKVLACLLAQGHLLLEDMPGLGKTTLAKALASALGCGFARVQCTPDLLPGDITGFSLFNQKTREFEFQQGPVFSEILLADEINRATPRSQSALLEAMAERQVTVDNLRHALPPMFFVIATQNPVEHHGTYPLPEAQLDRFAMKLAVGYPDRADEMAMLENAVGDGLETGAPRAEEPMGRNELSEMQRLVRAVAVEAPVRAYLVDLSRATRGHAGISLGVSPRGMLIWQRVAQAWAFLDGRRFVTPDDVQAVAEPVLSVRLGIHGAAPKGVTRVIGDLLRDIPAPF
jgi:MoxR-like ATPase